MSVVVTAIGRFVLIFRAEYNSNSLDNGSQGELIAEDSLSQLLGASDDGLGTMGFVSECR